MKHGPNIFQINARDPDPDLIAAACRMINSGGVVVFPATSLYGLAADAFNRSAVEKIQCMKNRSKQNPILLLVRNRDAVTALVEDIPPQAVLLMDKFWPGMVTLVFMAAGSVPGYLTSGTGKIGVRVPAHPVARSLVFGLDNPITGTSANISGQPGRDSITGLNQALVEPPDMILDAGRLKGGLGSTVVDVSVFPPRILREGVVSADLIFAALNG